MKWSIENMAEKAFFIFCRANLEAGERLCAMLLQLGPLEAVDDKSVNVVKEFVANEINAELTAAEERSPNEDRGSLSFSEFTEILGSSLWKIFDELIVIGPSSIDDLVSLGRPDNSLSNVKMRTIVIL
jgi:hypothetical protein